MGNGEGAGGWGEGGGAWLVELRGIVVVDGLGLREEISKLRCGSVCQE